MARDTITQVLNDARSTDYRGDYLYPEAVLAARLMAIADAVHDDRFNNYIEGIIAQAGGVEAVKENSSND